MNYTSEISVFKQIVKCNSLSKTSSSVFKNMPLLPTVGYFVLASAASFQIMQPLHFFEGIIAGLVVLVVICAVYLELDYVWSASQNQEPFTRLWTRSRHNASSSEVSPPNRHVMIHSALLGSGIGIFTAPLWQALGHWPLILYGIVASILTLAAIILGIAKHSH